MTNIPIDVLDCDEPESRFGQCLDCDAWAWLVDGVLCRECYDVLVSDPWTMADAERGDDA
jgi:hypothetical protein